MSYMQLLDPKGAAKAKDKGNSKKKKYYGTSPSHHLMPIYHFTWISSAALA